MSELNWQVGVVAWDSDEGRTAAKIRYDVFVVEQDVSEDEEWDDDDATGVHFLATGSGGRALGTGRLHIYDEKAMIGKVCRIAVLRDARGHGVGFGIVQAIIEESRRVGLRKLKLHSQTYAVEFYERLGFVAYGPEFLEANIPHRAMDLIL